MKMFTDKVGVPTIIAVVFVLLSVVIILPGTFNQFRMAGTGHSYGDLRDEGISHEEAREMAMLEGIKSGILMLLGQHIPITVLVLVAIGLVSKSTTIAFKRKLRILYLITTAGGICFLSLGLTYWGQAPPFPSSLGTAFVIYVLISAVLWIIIGVGVAIRANQRAEPSGVVDSNARISFTCPQCQTRYTAKPQQVGKEGKCKNCGAMIVVPNSNADVSIQKQREGKVI